MWSWHKLIKIESIMIVVGLKLSDDDRLQYVLSLNFYVFYCILLTFRSSITREKFEELCADIWEKSLLPVKTLLANSGLPANQIYAVELLGGATRVPKLQV